MGTTGHKENLKFTILSGIFIVPLLVGLFYLAIHCFLADSEIWAVTLAKQFGEWSSANISIYHKIPFYGLLRPLYFFFDSNQSLFVASRVVFALIGTLILLYTFKLGEVLYRDKRISWLAVVLIITSTFFVNRGFRIRADLLACLVHLIFLYQILLEERRPQFQFKGVGWLFAGLNVLLLLITPKAIFYFFAQLVFCFLVVEGQTAADPKQFRKTVLIAFAVPFALFFGLLFGSAFIAENPIVFSAYQKAMDFFQGAYFGQGGTPAAFSQLAFTYFNRFLAQNPVFSLMIIVSLVLSFYKFIGARLRLPTPWQIKEIFQAYCGVILFVLIYHNYRLPFFITTLIPPLALCAAFGFVKFVDLLTMKMPESRSHAKPFLETGLLVFLALGMNIKGFSYWQKNVKENNNASQFDFMNRFEKYIRQIPWASYYDVIGVLPIDNKHYIYVGSAQTKENEIAFQGIEWANPDILVGNNRFNFFSVYGQSKLLSDRILLAPTIFGKGTRINVQWIAPSKKKMVEVRGRRFLAISPDVLERALSSKFEQKFSADKTIYLYPKQTAFIYGNTNYKYFLLRNKKHQVWQMTKNMSLNEMKEKNIEWILVPADAERAYASLLPPMPSLYDLSHSQLFHYDTKF